MKKLKQGKRARPIYTLYFLPSIFLHVSLLVPLASIYYTLCWNKVMALQHTASQDSIGHIPDFT